MSAYRLPGSVPDQVPNLRLMLHDSENRTYVKQKAPWAKEKAFSNNLPKSGQRVPLTQGEISGQLHTAELDRVGAADRHQVPEAWNKSQGCLGGGICKKMQPTAPYLYFSFSPVQNKQPDMIVAPSPCSCEVLCTFQISPFWAFLSSVLNQSHLLGNPFKGFKISLLSWKTARANFYLLLDNINFLSFLLIFLAYERSLTRPTSKLNR